MIDWIRMAAAAITIAAFGFGAKAAPIDIGSPITPVPQLVGGLTGKILFGTETSFASGVATGAALMNQYGPDGTFIGSDINYGWSPTPTRSDWLNADAGSFVGNQTPGTVHLGATDGWYIQLDGLIYITAGYHAMAVTHDDAAVLKINGLTIIDGDVNTPPTTDSFGINAAASGYYPIHIDYTQTFPSLAVLVATYDFQFPTEKVGLTGILYHVPEPGSLALFGAGLAALVAVRRRRRS